MSVGRPFTFLHVQLLQPSKIRSPHGLAFHCSTFSHQCRFLLRGFHSEPRNVGHSTVNEVRLRFVASISDQGAKEDSGQSRVQEYTRLLPCPPERLPPRVEHVILDHSGAAGPVVASALNVPLKYAADLIAFGAVYYSPVLLPPPPSASPSIHAAFRALVSSSQSRQKAVPSRDQPPSPSLNGEASGEALSPGDQDSREGEDRAQADKLAEVSPRESVEGLLQAEGSSEGLGPRPGGTEAAGGVTDPVLRRNGEGTPVLRNGKGSDRSSRSREPVPLDGGGSDSWQVSSQPVPRDGNGPGPSEVPSGAAVARAAGDRQKKGERKGRQRQGQSAGGKPRRLESAEEELEAGGYVRAHVHPKRFPRCYEVDWAARILADTPDFVVLDKPAGIPVGGTVDNQVETCGTFAARALGLPSPLRITHQLDLWTEGCLVLAKTKAFAGHFNTLLRERRVSKVYRALTTAPVPTAPLVHFMRPDRYPPRIVSQEECDSWLRCELQVLDCRPVPWPSGGSPDLQVAEQDWAYECTVNLLTGRTHQVRTQLADIGAPLVGDTMYAPAALRLGGRRPQATKTTESASPCSEDSSEGGGAAHSATWSGGPETGGIQTRGPSRTSTPSSPSLTGVRQVDGAAESDNVSVVASRAAVRSSMDCSSDGDAEGSDGMVWRRTDELRIIYGPEASGAIGLQAWQLAWEGGPGTFEAGKPWWR